MMISRRSLPTTNKTSGVGIMERKFGHSIISGVTKAYITKGGCAPLFASLVCSTMKGAVNTDMIYRTRWYRIGQRENEGTILLYCRRTRPSVKSSSSSWSWSWAFSKTARAQSIKWSVIRRSLKQGLAPEGSGRLTPAMTECGNASSGIGPRRIESGITRLAIERTLLVEILLLEQVMVEFRSESRNE
jgi:hypothetical protein